MCCFGELLQEPAEFHFDFHVLQSGYVDHMDSSGIPDLAITEAAVGAGVTSVLFFVTLKKIHAIRREDDEDDRKEE